MIKIELHITFIRDVEKFRELLNKGEFMFLKIRSSIVMDAFKKQFPKDELKPVKGDGFKVIGAGSEEKINAELKKFEDFILNGVLSSNLKTFAEDRIMHRLKKRLRGASVNAFQRACSKTSPLMFLNMMGITVEWKIRKTPKTSQKQHNIAM